MRTSLVRYQDDDLNVKKILLVAGIFILFMILAGIILLLAEKNVARHNVPAKMEHPRATEFQNFENGTQVSELNQRQRQELNQYKRLQGSDRRIQVPLGVAQKRMLEIRSFDPRKIFGM